MSIRSSPIPKLATLSVLWFILALGCSNARRKPEFTFEHRDAIIAALEAKDYPQPNLELADSGYVVATFELDGVRRSDSGELETGPPRNKTLRAFAKETCWIVRNVMHKYEGFDKYRVVLNDRDAPAGMIRRYGVARFIEGEAQVTWEPAN